MNKEQLILAVRVIAQLDDLVSAQEFAAAVKNRLLAYGAIVEVDSGPYWKMRDQLLVTLSLRSAMPIHDLFGAATAALGEGWLAKNVGENEKSAVWNHPQGTFFDAAVRWANVEVFSDSCEM